MVCKHCGNEIGENMVCPYCGATQEPEQQNPYTNADSSTSPNPVSSEQVNQAEETQEISQEEISSGKVMAVLSYLGCLMLIPLFAGRKNKFSKFHLNQGLALFVTNVLLSVIVNCIPKIGSILAIFVSIIMLIFEIIGIVNAATGKVKELPLIGKIKIVK